MRGSSARYALADVGSRDIQRIIDNLYDGPLAGSSMLPVALFRKHLEQRRRLLPDFLLERNGEYFLAECKSWAGFRSGKFDIATAQAAFIEEVRQGAFLLVATVEGQPIAGKVLIVSSRSDEGEAVENFLAEVFMTHVEILYLDEILCALEVQATVRKQLTLLDAAVSMLKRDLLEGGGSVT